MAGKGAPKGNQYAKKEAERGISFSYYLDSYEFDFLKQSVLYDGKEPNVKNVRAKAKQLTREAMNKEMHRTFARYASERQKEEAMIQHNAELDGRAEQEVLDKGHENKIM